MTTRARAVPSGFSLVEILVAMTLTLAVFAITLPFVRAQTRALGETAGRLDADQIARYAQRAIDRDLRLATADVGQPLLVYAGPMGIAFNANLLARDTADAGAADLAVGAHTTLTESWRFSDAGPLPFDSRDYPPDDYDGPDGGVSRNETISYFLHADTISGRNDLYVLYRRVNARDSVQVVRALQVPADSGFFSYHRPVAGVLTRIATARLPLFWDSTAVDSITTVGVRATGFYRERTTGRETMRTVHWRTRLPNSASRVPPRCGARPGTPDDLDADEVTNSAPYRVELTWERSADDGAGEDDVRYYLIDRQLGAGAWVTLATIPATGALTYDWVHANPGSGNFTYGVRAIDCGAQTSTRDADGVGTIP